MPLNSLTKYVYGTTRLGDNGIPFSDRETIAREAINKGLWIHTSHSYGNALEVLRAAFDKDRSKIPNAIFKIGWDSVAQIREVIHQNIDPLAIPSMAIGQLCLGSSLSEQLATGGTELEGLKKLKDEGLVGGYVLETWPWNSNVPLAALRGGHLDGLVDGLIFYLNPLQRFVSNELWDEIHAREIPILAMRTVAGGTVYPTDRAPQYLRERAAEVAPLFEASGVESWTEFCVRFALGTPNVLCTVGSTASSPNLMKFVTASQASTPLPKPLMDEILALHRQWADEHDAFAEPWTM
jgi:hypothetical protein